MPAAASLLTRMCTVASEISSSLAMSTNGRNASRLKISNILRFISSSRSDGNSTNGVRCSDLITIRARMINNSKTSLTTKYALLYQVSESTEPLPQSQFRRIPLPEVLFSLNLKENCEDHFEVFHDRIW